MRDLRDPRKHGTALMRLRKTDRFKNKPLHAAADAIDIARHSPGVKATLPNYAIDIDLYPGDETSVALTTAARQTELRDRAASGDRYAASLLAGKYIGEDPVD